MPSAQSFRRVVVGYNASFSAHAALRLALSMTEAEQAQVTVVSVAREPVGSNTEMQPYTTPTELDHDRCRSWLTAAAQYAAEFCRRIDTQLWIGPVHKALSEAAAAQGADLIIVGAPAHARWRPRGTGARIARHSPCPVLAVPR